MTKGSLLTLAWRENDTLKRNDSFMLAPSNYQHGEIVAMDRAYIDYAKFEELTERNVVYVTKLKKNLVYEILADSVNAKVGAISEICCTFAITSFFSFPTKQAVQSSLGDFFVSYAKIQKLYGIGTLIVRFI